MNAIVKLALLAAPSAIATGFAVWDLNRGARRQIESIGSSGAVTTVRPTVGLGWPLRDDELDWLDTPIPVERPWRKITDPACRARLTALLPELEEKQKTLPHGL